MRTSSPSRRAERTWCSDATAWCARRRGGQELDPFLRWIVSGWNSSNAVGVWFHYGSTGQPGYVSLVPPPEHIEAALRNHVRIWRRSGWNTGGRPPDFDRVYYPALKRLQERELKTLGALGTP